MLAIGLIGQAAVLLRQSRTLWFFRDDFSFMLYRSLSHDPVRQLMVPHNEHWSTFPVLSFRVMWAIFGMRHYLPYAVLPVLLHLATAAFLTVLMRAAGAGRWSAVLTGLAFAFLAGGAGAENPLWAFQIGFIGSCLGGVLAWVCLDRDDVVAPHAWWRGRWFWLGQASLIVALMCSGMGVPMVVTAACWALLRGARRDGILTGLLGAARTAALPTVVYAAWYAAWGHGVFASQIGSSTVGTPGSTVQAALHGLGHIWAAATLVPWAGPVMLAVLVAGVVAAWSSERLFALGAAGLAGLVFLYLLVGYGRSAHGLTMILHSRYLYVGLVLSAPAVACVVEAFAARIGHLRWVAIAGWVVIGALVVALGSHETASYAADRRAQDPGLRERVLAARAIVESGTHVLNPVIDPFDHLPTPSLTVTAMNAAHGWAKLPAGPPSTAAIFNERAVLQVAVAQAPLPIRAAAHVQWNRLPGYDGPVTVPASCDTETVAKGALLRVRLHKTGGQIALDLSGIDSQDEIRTWVKADGRTSVSRYWRLAGGDGRYYVATNLRHSTLLVQLPAATVRVCPVDATGSRPAHRAS